MKVFLYVHTNNVNTIFHLSSLQKEIVEQELKKERVEKQMSKLIQQVRKAKKSKDELPEEKDIDLRELRDFNNSIMKQLGEVLHNHPDIAPAVHLYFTQAGLPMPPSPGPGQTSRSMSKQSSRSSLSSVRYVVFVYFVLYCWSPWLHITVKTVA